MKLKSASEAKMQLNRSSDWKFALLAGAVTIICSCERFSGRSTMSDSCVV